MDYKTSGVDIEAGNAFVDRLKLKAPSIGGFNGMMQVPSGYEEPVLVSGADGVGTKIKSTLHWWIQWYYAGSFRL